MASLIEYLEPHATVSSGGGETTYYPARGYMFVLDMGDSIKRLEAIIVRVDGTHVLEEVGGAELEQTCPFDELDITVWSKIHRQ